jgi:hypothetical protein
MDLGTLFFENKHSSYNNPINLEIILIFAVLVLVISSY